MPTLDSSIFDLAPIPMWLEDYSGIKIQFDEWRDQGIQDLRTFLREDLERVRQCAHKIKLIRVNQKTLQLFEAASFEQLCDNLAVIFQQDMLDSHLNELVDLWEGKTLFSSMAVNYTLSGRRLIYNCTVPFYRAMKIHLRVYWSLLKMSPKFTMHAA